MPIRLTHKDKKLLHILRGNARASITEIAKLLGVSRSTIQKRLERLEGGGVISGYTVQLNSNYLDQEIKAQVMITVSPSMTSSIINSMSLIEGVRTIYSVSGPHDLITEVAALNMAELDATIDSIIEIDGVERTVSSVILSTRLKR